METDITVLLAEAAKVLADYLYRVLPAISENWWKDNVLKVLTLNQRQRVEKTGTLSLSALDLAALLGILDRNWYEISNKMNFLPEARHFVKEMHTVRNHWAHPKVEGFANEDIYRDLDTLQRFATVIDAKADFIERIKNIKAYYVSQLQVKAEPPLDFEVRPHIEPHPRRRRFVPTATAQEAPLSIKENIKINDLTLKVEKVNAKGMIEGFRKDGRYYYVTIFTASKNSWSLKKQFRQKPKIITAMRGKPKPIYPLSKIGIELNADRYLLNARYLAILDRIFHIRNDKSFWNTLCNNGIFDIWDLNAPFNSLKGKQDPMILLLRIFELGNDLSGGIEAGTHCDIVKEQEVKIIKPIIPNEYFSNITAQIRSTVKDFLVKEEPVCDTSKMQ